MIEDNLQRTTLAARGYCLVDRLERKGVRDQGIEFDSARSNEPDGRRKVLRLCRPGIHERQLLKVELVEGELASAFGDSTEDYDPASDAYQVYGLGECL